MLGTQEDMTALQDLLDECVARAGPFLRESFEIPERSLTAGQLMNCLQGLNTVALGTATRTGAPSFTAAVFIFLPPRPRADPDAAG